MAIVVVVPAALSAIGRDIVSPGVESDSLYGPTIKVMACLRGTCQRSKEQNDRNNTDCAERMEMGRDEAVVFRFHTVSHLPWVHHDSCLFLLEPHLCLIRSGFDIFGILVAVYLKNENASN